MAEAGPESAPALPGGPAPHDQELFLRLVDSVQDYAIFALNAFGIVSTWNTGAERLKGYKPEEIIGKHFSIFYPPDKPRAVIDGELEIAVREGRFREEGWRVKSDGSRFWANVTITPIRGALGDVLGFAKVTRDMTMHRRAAEQGEQLARETAARANAQSTASRLEALVATSRALAEAGLDFGAVAKVIARKAAEYVGDLCVLRVVRGDVLEPIGAFHRDPAALAALEEVLKPEVLDRDTPAARAVRERITIVTSARDVAAATSRTNPPYGAFLDDRYLRCILAVPLLLPGGEAVGVLSLARFGPDAIPYSEEDRHFVESLAFRAALAVTNARLFKETERAHAEARDAHEQLRLIFRGIAEGILVQDPVGHIVVANDAAARMCGFATAEELMSAPIAEVLARFEIMDETGAPFPLENLPARRALRGEDQPEAVLFTRARSGSGGRWSITRATALREPDGTARYAVSVFEDVTDRRRVVERLRFLADAGDLLGSSMEYEQTLGAVASLAVPRIADWCTVDVLDEQGRLRRLGVAHVDPAKVAWARDLETRYPTRLDDTSGIAAVLRTGQSEMISEVTDEMIVGAARDGEHLRMIRELGLRSYICVPLVARDRTIGALTLLATDESGRRYDDQDLTVAQLLGRRAGLAVENARLFTQTQHALADATQASRMKDDFLATLSHELRTPLNAIVGWSQMLVAGGLTPALAQKAVETIHRNANLQSRLISDILDVSRIVAGKVRLDVRATHPIAAIEAAIDTLGPAAAAKGIRIETVLDPSAGPVSGDPERLQQILWNLLSNAIKFVPKDGRIEVRLEAVNSYVEITVQDNGPGMDAAFLPHVFDRFRQADSSSTRAHGGLGLGLAIVRHLVELHGGEVRAANRTGSSGAIFTVRLPRRAIAIPAVADPVAAAGEARDTSRGPYLRGIKVLVVDDEEDARDLVAAALGESGADVVKAASAGEALDAIGVFRPHVLIADIEMPGQDGYQLLTSLRARPEDAGALTPAIALTAYAGGDDRVRALSAGFDIHMAKPVGIAELRAAVARLAGQRR
jgi:PAS domain S-box-containing protein